MVARSYVALITSLIFATACHERARTASQPRPRDAAVTHTDAATDAATDAGSRAVSPALAELDTRLHAQEHEATFARADDWLSWERIAIGYMDRARLSADYNDYAHAEQALARSFAHASPGVGPFLTRARFNYAVHRLNRVVADLDALRFAMLNPNERESIAHLRAEVAFFSGRYDEAHRLYDENLARERSVTNLVALAQFQWKTGHFPEAERLVTEADTAATHEDAAMHAWVCLVRGMMELDRGRWEPALAAFRDGLRIQPTSWMFQEHVAEVLRFLGHDEEARLMYVDLVERTGDPEFVDALAQIYEKRHDEASARPLIDRARAAYEERLRIMPEATAGHAIEFFLRRDASRAVPVAEINRDARPGGEAQTRLAEAYLGAGRVADAQRVIEATLATAWNTAALHGVASKVFARAGDARRANEQRALALAIDPHALDGDANGPTIR